MMAVSSSKQGPMICTPTGRRAVCAGGRGHSGQRGQRRVRGPEGLLSVGPFPLGGGDGALAERPGVMRERRGEVHRAQENVDVPEVACPGGTGRQPQAFLLDDRGQRREVLGARLRVGKEQRGLEAE